MNIMILSAGQRQLHQEQEYPLCLTEFDGIPLIQHIISSCKKLGPRKLITIFRAEEVLQYHLDDIVSLLWQDAVIIGANDGTQGAACTALLAVSSIEDNDELLILNGNEFIDEDFSGIVSEFRKRKLDAGVVVFDSIHPRYSYVRVGDDGLVTEAAEKRPISSNATAGFYWYANGSNFVQAAKSMIRKDARINDNFYICPVLNELVLQQKQVGVFRIKSECYHPLKTDRQVELYEAVTSGVQRK